MQELTAMLKDTANRTVSFWLYGKSFQVSRAEDNDEVWIDINEYGHVKVRVKTEEELVIYIRNHVQQAPLFDEMILFNVKIKVCQNLHLNCDSEEK